MAESSSKLVENTVVKGEIARHEQFLHFPRFFFFFSKDLYCIHVKNQGLFGKGLNPLQAIPSFCDLGRDTFGELY